jgi:hypothetical protein
MCELHLVASKTPYQLWKQLDQSYYYVFLWRSFSIIGKGKRGLGKIRLSFLCIRLLCRRVLGPVQGLSFLAAQIHRPLVSQLDAQR